MDIVYREIIGSYLQVANGPKNNECVGIFMKSRKGGWSDYQPPSIALPPLPEAVSDIGKREGAYKPHCPADRLTQHELS